jgi:hypothetical protein
MGMGHAQTPIPQGMTMNRIVIGEITRSYLRKDILLTKLGQLERLAMFTLLYFRIKPEQVHLMLLTEGKNGWSEIFEEHKKSFPFLSFAEKDKKFVVKLMSK